MEYFVISAKFVPLKYYTLSSQLRRLTSFSVGLFGSANSVTRSYPVMRKSCIAVGINAQFHGDSHVRISLPLALVRGYSVNVQQKEFILVKDFAVRTPSLNPPHMTKTLVCTSHPSSSWV